MLFLGTRSCHCSGLWLQTQFWRHFLQDMIQLYFLLVTFTCLKVKAPLLAYLFICLLSLCFPLAGTTLTTNMCLVDDAVQHIIIVCVPEVLFVNTLSRCEAHIVMTG
jgi:hypothetical protein